MSEGHIEKVAPVRDFREGVPLSLQLSSGEQVCLVLSRGEIFGIADECPDGGFPLSDGAIVDDYIIECAMHGTQFDVRDGSAVEQPGEVLIQTFGVEVVDDDVWVHLLSG